MKRVLSAAMALFILIGAVCIAPNATAATATLDEIVNAAANIVMQNEGYYGSVASNDGGALSIGWIQWHGNRALNLLKSIVYADTVTAQIILGDALYKEITTSSDWSSRTLTADENSKISKLIDTPIGHAEQDKLAKSDLSVYINHGMQLGISSPAVLVYFADIENQCGGGGSARVAAAACEATGSYSSITLKALHNAALADKVAGKAIFIPRREGTFTKCSLLGWDAIAEAYEVWTANGTSLNIRSGPGVQFSRVSALGNGASTVIFGKTMVNGSMWGKSSVGWLNLEYCKYSSGSLPTPVHFELDGDSGYSDCIVIDGVNTARGANMTVIYNASSSTGTNIFGAEAVVGADGLVTADPKPGSSNSPIPAGGFVISGHTDSASGRGTEICEKIKAGCYVYFNKETMTAEIYDTQSGYLAAMRRSPRRVLVADGVNCIRDDGMLIVYDSTNGGTSTGTNMYGAEVAVGSDGKVISAPSYEKNNLPIPAGGFVISGHDGSRSSAATLCNSIRAGDFVSFNKSTMTISVFSDEESYLFAAKTLSSGSAVGALPELSKPGSAFIGWYTAPAGGEKVTPQTIFDSHSALKLYPRWGVEAPVIFDTNGGCIDGVTKKTVTNVNTFRGADAIILYNNSYKHTNTGTNEYGADIAVGADGKVIGSVSYGVCDLKIPEDGFVISGHDAGYTWMSENITPDSYITFDAQTKTLSVYRDSDVFALAYKQLAADSAIGELPVASREGCFIFTGWETAEGEAVSADTVVPYGGITLYAQWTEHGDLITETVAPTCTEDGRKAEICSLCNAVISEELLPATDHAWTAVGTTEPDCTTEGFTDYICENDPEHTKRDNIVPATGEHTPAEAVTEKEATCTEDGVRRVYCAVCGELISEEIIPMIGHSWIAAGTTAPDCINDGFTEYICENDPEHTKRDNIVPAAGEHSFGDAVTVKEATCEENGLRQTCCTVCSEIVAQETIPAIGHKWVRAEDAEPDADLPGYVLYVCENDPRHVMRFSYTTENTVFGDVNNDGYTDSDDAIYLLHHLTDYKEYPIDIAAQQNCDFNGDGKTDADDAIYLLYHILLPARFKLVPEADEAND